MTVAYYLILDKKRRKLLSSSPIMHATQPPPPPQDDLNVANITGQLTFSQLQAMPPTLDTSPPPPQQLSSTEGGQISAPVLSMQQRGMEAMQRRWHLGVQSSMPPADMMLEIFRALRTLQATAILAEFSFPYSSKRPQSTHPAAWLTCPLVGSPCKH